MPVLQIDIQTRVGEVYMSNVYHVIATDYADAIVQGDLIVFQQAKVLPDAWLINHMRISTPALADNSFVSRPLNVPGTRASSSQGLPLYCRFRVDFSVGFRRPLRKFLVGVLEDDQATGLLTQAAINLVTVNYVDPLKTQGTVKLCALDGTPVNGGAVVSAVGMRQLRRGSKRKKPVI
jgi:hypothetical protein